MKYMYWYSSVIPHVFIYILIFAIIAETNKFKKSGNCFKISEHVSIDIQSIIVNHLKV